MSINLFFMTGYNVIDLNQANISNILVLHNSIKGKYIYLSLNNTEILKNNSANIIVKASNNEYTTSMTCDWHSGETYTIQIDVGEDARVTAKVSENAVRIRGRNRRSRRRPNYDKIVPVLTSGWRKN